jgi:hypothetical protein
VRRCIPQTLTLEIQSKGNTCVHANPDHREPADVRPHNRLPNVLTLCGESADHCASGIADE